MALRLILEVHVTVRSNRRSWHSEAAFLVPLNPKEDLDFFNSWTLGMAQAIARLPADEDFRVEVVAARYQVDDVSSFTLLEAMTMLKVDDPDRWLWQETTDRRNGKGVDIG